MTTTSSMHLLIGAQQAIPNPRRRTSISPRLDYQLTPSNTLTMRYQFTQDDHTNDGRGRAQPCQPSL